MTTNNLLRLGAVWAALLCAILVAEDKPDEANVPPPLTEYQGRLIAQTMHYTGAEWLVRNEREREERCSLMLAKLGVTPGMNVCDMGCGNGFYTVKMAKMAGDRGHVYAVDIQPEMLEKLKQRTKLANVENYTPLLGSTVDPK